MNQNFQKLERFLNEERIIYKKNELMKNHTSFKIGGCCKILTYPQNFKQVSCLIQFLNKSRIKYFFLGNGSNTLFSDSDFLGVVICSKLLNKLELLKNGEIYCESGVPLNKLCQFALFNSLSNLEFAYGIPGSVGGAVLMNAGAYGGEMKDVVTSVKYCNCDGQILSLINEEINFSYRQSIFNKNGGFILSATFKCVNGNQKIIKQKMDTLIQRRILKQPLNFPSAGSVFKRPKQGFASKLIDSCGLKGEFVGDARVSEKHCGFIINVGDARCSDVLKLIKKIQNVVKKQTGIDLEPEIKIVK